MISFANRDGSILDEGSCFLRELLLSIHSLLNASRKLHFSLGVGVEGGNLARQRVISLACVALIPALAATIDVFLDSVINPLVKCFQKGNTSPKRLVIAERRTLEERRFSIVFTCVLRQVIEKQIVA